MSNVDTCFQRSSWAGQMTQEVQVGSDTSRLEQRPTLRSAHRESVLLSKKQLEPVVQTQQVGDRTDPISINRVVSGFDQMTAGIQSYHACLDNLDALCVR